MAIDEHSRHQLYRSLQETIGSPAADTLMELLPPVGWADVATKRDLEHYAEVNRRDHEQLASTLREEMRAMEARFERALRSQMAVILSVMSGLFVAFATVIVAFVH
jgi:hypothetical protein